MVGEAVPTALVPDGLVVVVKADCPTCVLVEPVVRQLSEAGGTCTVLTQDDPMFPGGVAGVVDDRDLELSWRLGIETVPTVLRIEGGKEVARTVGWDRDRWETLTGLDELGPGLAGYRPGCGSRSVEPGVAEALAVRFGADRMASRRIELGDLEDDVEAMYDRGWSDGLPLVPPTEARVLAMLSGTDREPGQVVAVVPPNLVPVTVEKVAINAVLAGCRPDYLPVVLAAVEAACTDEFNIHGVLATTWFAGPMIVVNGPVAAAIGCNSGVNALGPGSRANATIGRALQLVIRNVGGGRPGEVDRATLGTPAKYTFCFAEDESGSPWEPLSVARGFDRGASTVTLFAAGGIHGVADQQSRTPESLSRSLALGLRSVGHHKAVLAFDATLVVCPEHGRVFREARWSRDRLESELAELLTIPADELVQGAGGIAEGVPRELAEGSFPKFRDDGLLIVHAGGGAGMFSAVIDGWVGGRKGSVAVTREVVV